jgi:hypothetical protein
MTEATSRLLAGACDQSVGFCHKFQLDKTRGQSPRFQKRKRLSNNALRQRGTLFRGNYPEILDSKNRGKSTRF